MTCLDFMEGLGIGAASILTNLISERVARSDFGNFFILFILPKMILVDTNGLFVAMFNNTFQETLFILVYSVARGNRKEIRNKLLHFYLNKPQKKNSHDKGSLHPWLYGLLFSLHIWNE